MEIYEIRVVKRGRGQSSIYSSSHGSDSAAIERAINLAEDGDAVEVWRGLRCVYSGDLCDLMRENPAAAVSVLSP